jgi:septum formation protein
MEPIILASGSQRRKEFLKLLSLPFNIMPAQINEEITGNPEPSQITQEFAVKKVQRVIEILGSRSPQWVLGADTLVVVGGRIFGKPKNQDDARRMLERLSGRKHEVITAMALFNGKNGNIDCRSARTVVQFDKLNEGELQWYLDTGEWQEAAGGYRLQGLASCFIKSIQGSPSNVVGLPIHDLYCMLKDNGYPYSAWTLYSA